MKTNELQLRHSLIFRELWAYKTFAEKEIEELQKKNITLEMTARLQKKIDPKKEKIKHLKGVFRKSGIKGKQLKLLLALATFEPRSKKDLRLETRSVNILRLITDTKKTLQKVYGRLHIIRVYGKEGKRYYQLLHK